MACKCRNIGLSWAAQPILGTVYLFIFSYYNSRLAWAKVKEKKMLLHSSELVTVRNSWSFWGRVNHLIWPNSNFAISWGSDTNPWHHYDQESLRNLVPLDRVFLFSWLSLMPGVNSHLSDESSCTWWPWARASAPSPPWSGSPWWERRCCRRGRRTWGPRHSGTPSTWCRILGKMLKRNKWVWDGRWYKSLD